jgi:hypothetical protein
VQAELAARGAQVGGEEPVDGADTTAGARGVDEHRLGAAVEVRARVQARGAGVDRLDAAVAQATVDVLAEAVVAVPGVAEADDARGAHPNVNCRRGAPRTVAT